MRWWEAVVLGLALAVAAAEEQEAEASEWRPLGQAEARLVGPADHCTLHKVVMHQGHFPQYMQYKTNIPDLKEFTLCGWHMFYNHTTDHPIFSYSSRGKAGHISSWVSNNIHSSYYQLAVNGHTLYRVNYPVRLHKWYHVCQSWNGRNGEWQLWVNSERVGRGFYNILAGKVVKGGGKAMTGQEGRLPGAGLMGEVTLLQLYKAALTQGKAYYNHKHHHAHKFHHEDMLGEDDPENLGNLYNSQLSQLSLQPQAGGLPGEGPKMEGLLVGMQLVPRLPVDELSAKPGLNLVPAGKPGLNLLSPADLLTPFSSSSVRLFKRDQANATRERREATTETPAQALPNKTHAKRGAEENLALLQGLDLSAFYGGELALLGGNGGEYSNGGGRAHTDNYVEPAMWEVQSVMSLCSACGEDPFRKANILSWSDTPKKLAGGALFVEANQECHHF